jgi:hypothetical protein
MYRGRIARLCPDLVPVERQHSVFAYALTMEVKIPEHVLRKNIPALGSLAVPPCRLRFAFTR